MGFANVSEIVLVKPAALQAIPTAEATVAVPGPVILKSEPLAAIELHFTGIFVFTVRVVQASDADV